MNFIHRQTLQPTLFSWLWYYSRDVEYYSYSVIATLPTDTERTLYFGYNLVHVILKSAGVKPPSTSGIFVSTKPVSMDEIVSHTLDEAGIGPRSIKTREKIESQIEVLAATIGPPADRMVLFSRYLQRTGGLADMIGAGLEISLISIINRQTGMAAEIVFFERADNLRSQL